MRVLAVLGFLLFTACEKGAVESIPPYDSEIPDDSSSHSDSGFNGIQPLSSELILTATWETSGFPSGNTIAGTSGGLLVSRADVFDVVRIPWSAGIGAFIERDSSVLIRYDEVSDSIRSWPDGAVSVGFSAGFGLAAFYPVGVDSLSDVSALDAPIVIRGAADRSEVSPIFREDVDGDSIFDLLVTEALVPGYVRALPNEPALSGTYSAPDAPIVLEACQDNAGRGATYVERFGGNLLAVGCGNDDWSSGRLDIFSLPVTPGQVAMRTVSGVSGFLGASLDANAPLYLDRRGAGVLAILQEDGETLTYHAPSEASATFGASPVLVEFESRYYLAIGDSNWADTNGDIVGRVVVCDVTEEKTPDLDWFADCVYLSVESSLNLLNVGATVDADVLDYDNDGDQDLVISASGWESTAQTTSGVCAWVVRR
jgi:hypothetical protein